jgi:hypothetical protein
MNLVVLRVHNFLISSLIGRFYEKNCGFWKQNFNDVSNSQINVDFMLLLDNLMVGIDVGCYH